MDVETAFLYGEIDEEIFIKSPVGMEEIDPGSSPEDCYQLLKGIYGLSVPSSQTILEKICEHNKAGTLWIPSQPSRSLHAI